MSTKVWLVTLIGLSLILTLDFLMAIKNRNKRTSLGAATTWTLFYVSLAIIFGFSLGLWRDVHTQSSFFAGWITEYSLSFDNLFVFILILAKLKISKEREELVLLIGIVLSLILRGIFIWIGTELINRWSWIFFVFGAFLIYTAIQLIRESEEEEWEEGKFIAYVRSKGASIFTVACVAIAITNVLFAFDSIPAIFGLTKDFYVIITANLFAMMGLRQLYFLIGGLMKRLIYLTEGLAIILIFIGVKLILEAGHGQGWSVPEISIQASLSFIIFVILFTTIISLVKSKGKQE